MDSPDSRAPPPKNSPTQGRSWIPSTSYTWPATPWMNAADAPGKNSTTGVGGPRISLQGPQGAAHQILPTHRAPAAPDTQPVFRRRARRTRGPWSAYQNIIDAYRAPNTSVGKALMQAEIERLSNAGVPSSLTEIITLGRTLKRRATDILAYFDHPHTTGGPTKAANAPLEHLRGSAPELPQPHPLHHPSTPRNRRIQTPTTPPIIKSPQTSSQSHPGLLLRPNPSNGPAKPPTAVSNTYTALPQNFQSRTRYIV